MQRYILRADGRREELSQPVSLREAMVLIGGARTVDVVKLYHLGRAPLHVMLIDGDGWESEAVERREDNTTVIELRPVRPRLPVNEQATALYWANCRPGTTHQIVGDVIVCPDEDYE